MFVYTQDDIYPFSNSSSWGVAVEDAVCRGWPGICLLAVKMKGGQIKIFISAFEEIIKKKNK
jgi:hypothetical protein